MGFSIHENFGWIVLLYVQIPGAIKDYIFYILYIPLQNMFQLTGPIHVYSLMETFLW